MPFPSLLTCLAILLSAATPFAVADEGEPKKVALVVGVNKYQKPGFRDLDFAEADVIAVGQELTKLGFRVTVLLGSSEGEARATRENIERTARQIIEPLSKRDVALVMLSGHGQQLMADPQEVDFTKSQSYYCPVDAILNRPDSQVALSDLTDSILAPNVGIKLLIVDACRDVPDDQTRGSHSSKGIEGRVVSLPEDTGVFFSCRAGQVSFERHEVGHGLFTYCLLDGLRGGAVRDGELAWADLVAHVNRRMVQPEMTKLMPAEMRQVPIPAGAVPHTALGTVHPHGLSHRVFLQTSAALFAEAEHAALRVTNPYSLVDGLIDLAEREAEAKHLVNARRHLDLALTHIPQVLRDRDRSTLLHRIASDFYSLGATEAGRAAFAQSLEAAELSEEYVRAWLYQHIALAQLHAAEHAAAQVSIQKSESINARSEFWMEVVNQNLTNGQITQAEEAAAHIEEVAEKCVAMAKIAGSEAEQGDADSAWARVEAFFAEAHRIDSDITASPFYAAESGDWWDVPVICHAIESLSRRGYKEKLRALLADGLQAAEQCDWEDEQVERIVQIAVLQGRLGDVAAAAASLQRALTIARQQEVSRIAEAPVEYKERAQLLESLRSQGRVVRVVVGFAELDDLLTAGRLLGEVKESSDIYLAVEAIALGEARAGRFDDAIARLHQAYEERLVLRVVADMAEAGGNAAAARKARRRAAEAALEELAASVVSTPRDVEGYVVDVASSGDGDTALALVEKLGTRHSRANALSRIAVAFAQTGDFHRSVETLDRLEKLDLGEEAYSYKAKALSGLAVEVARRLKQ